MIGLVGKKVGMICIFIEDGVFILVIVIEVEVNCVIQVKDLVNDGYCVIQVIIGVKKVNCVIKLEVGYFVKVGVEVGCGLWEFCLVDGEEFIVGQNISVELFVDVKKVDVIGIFKGKGFVGIVKCWNFCIQDVIYGNFLFYCVLGFIGQNQILGKVFKGKKMVGQLGNECVIVQSLDVVCVDVECNLLLVKGVVLGVIGSDLIVKLVVKV